VASQDQPFALREWGPLWQFPPRSRRTMAARVFSLP